VFDPQTTAGVGGEVTGQKSAGNELYEDGKNTSDPRNSWLDWEETEAVGNGRPAKKATL